MIKSLHARLVHLLARRRPVTPATFTFALAMSPNGNRTLTVFEGAKAVSIGLSPEQAVDLAAQLSSGAEGR